MGTKHYMVTLLMRYESVIFFWQLSIFAHQLRCFKTLKQNNNERQQYIAIEIPVHSA